MQEVIIGGIALAFTGLLLRLRSWLFRRPLRKPHYVYVLSQTSDGDGRCDSVADDEWPSVIELETQPLYRSAPAFGADEEADISPNFVRLIR